MICIPIHEKNMIDTLAQIKKAAGKADLIEIWVDDIKGLDLKKLLKSTKKRLILKAVRKLTVLKEAIGKVAFIDIDIKTTPKIIKELTGTKTQLIISFHDHKRTPTQKQLEQKIEKAFKLGADIAKVATSARTERDNVKVLSLLTKFSDKKIIATCMGEKGRLGRIIGLIMGSYISYAASSEKTRTAKGQLTIEEVKKIVKWH